MPEEAPTPPVVPLTSDQERYLNERIGASLKRYVKRATVGFGILFAGLVTTYSIAAHDNDLSRQAIVDSGQAVAITSCNRDFDQAQRARAGIRSEFRNGLGQLALFVKEGTITEAQGERLRKESIREKNADLKDTPLPDCRQADDQLTSDPDDDIKVPAPKYPGYQRG